MLLNIGTAIPPFLDIQETTMTTMTKLSALTLVAATVLGAAALAPASASAKGYVGGFHRITSSGNGTGNFHLRATALAGTKLMPPRQNAFAAGFKPFRQLAVVGQPVARIGATTPVAHQPPVGGKGGVKPDFDIGGAIDTVNDAINKGLDAINEGLELLNNDPGPTCGWLVCSDGSK
jgi:hypothetical protein